MPHGFFFQRVMAYGPVEIGTDHNREGRNCYTAACTTDGCGWSGDFNTYSGACMAAKGHHCQIR
ncbi:mobile element transfer protein [Streptomyces kanamyceticus]|uniref:Mobile element transfer n=1 Tax=Streptomyces kanamyceticus TaxID=1967 RepID=A0A5J6GEL4_STRKN|nr:mobile element transfer protein [Streptomyces kanamyceticus]QEU93989.1 Mobile element transfer [Streptomyces kanamyceticus]